jgi:hypothetical protein
MKREDLDTITELTLQVMDERLMHFIKRAQERQEKKMEDYLSEVLLLHQTSKQIKTAHPLATVVMGIVTVAVMQPQLLQKLAMLIAFMLQKEDSKDGE